MTGTGSTDIPAPRGVIFAAVAVVFALLFGPVSGHALEDPPILQGEFWAETDPMVKDDGVPYPLTQDQIVEQVLAEARFVFSGMIYGFRFLYTPSDALRNVEEIFTLEPIAQIPWADPGLRAAEVRVSQNRQYLLVRYYPHDFQRPWIRSWSAASLRTATAVGRGDLFLGVEQKDVAVHNAVKEAIRHYYRGRVANKPKEVSGDVALSAVPYVVIDAGTYRAKVTVAIRERKIVPYRAY